MGQGAPGALRPPASFCPRISGELLNTLKGHTGGVYSVCVTADRETVVSGSDDKTVRLWRWSTGVDSCARLRVAPFGRGPARAAAEDAAGGRLGSANMVSVGAGQGMR